MERPKTFVDLNLAGVPIGDNASKFSTRAGDFIRIHIPVNKSDWRLVPINRKNDLWNALMVSISTLDLVFLVLFIVVCLFYDINLYCRMNLNSQWTMFVQL